MRRIAKLEFIPHTSQREPVIDFLKGFLKQMGLPSPNPSLRDAFDKIFDLVMKSHEEATFKKPMELEVFESAKHIQIQIRNRGLPLFPDAPWAADPWDQHIRKTFLSLSTMVDGLTYQNQSREGQVLSLLIEKNIDTQPNETKSQSQEDVSYTIRPLKDGEETKLSRLFCSVYGYDYINSYVYEPELLRRMIHEGRLISSVAATSDGRLLGHMGLVRWNTQPRVYEAALGIVDPRIKSKGLFSEIFKANLQTMSELQMDYCLYDFVTNHDYSQRLVHKFGCVEMALFLGNQAPETQARLQDLGMGSDPNQSDRYSLLVGIAPRVPHPFGKEVALPINIGESCDFILKPLGVNWVPTPRFWPLAEGGSYAVQRQKEQKALIVDLFQPGRKALNSILQELPNWLREGIQYIAVDVPITPPGLSHIHDQLSNHGFFKAGFIPYRFSNQLGFRFQFLGPTRISFEEIKLFSPTAQKILSMVKTDYERNLLL